MKAFYLILGHFTIIEDILGAILRFIVEKFDGFRAGVVGILDKFLKKR